MTLEVVLFDDVELWATGALRTALAARAEPYTDDVYVDIDSPTAGSTQANRPRVVTIRRDGGPRLDIARDAARVAVNVWANTEQDCNDLARMVCALMWASPDGTNVVRVDQTTGPSTIPDDRPHKYMTFDVLLRGVSA
jgi:hypothetical protein